MFLNFFGERPKNSRFGVCKLKCSLIKFPYFYSSSIISFHFNHAICLSINTRTLILINQHSTGLFASYSTHRKTQLCKTFMAVIYECYRGKSVRHARLFIFNFVVNLQVLMTRLTPVNKTRLFLKSSDFNKNRLVAFHSSCYKESNFMCEKCKRVWMTLIHFLLLPADSCYQPTADK
jgi:hypothetical protein